MAIAASRSGLRRIFSSSPAFTPPTEPKSNHLFVSGLNKRTTTEGLKAAFEKLGQVVHARVLTEPNFAYLKGFGFMKYGTLDEAAEGIKGIGGHYLDGWAIFTEYTKPKAPPSPPLYLYPSRCSLRWMMSRRFLTTQAQTITGADGGGGSRRCSRVNSYSYFSPPTPLLPPCLMLSSSSNPQFRYLYDLLGDQIKFKTEIHLPRITDHIFIGTSSASASSLSSSLVDGTFLLSIPISESTNIHAINPLTGVHLPIPPTNPTFFCGRCDFPNKYPKETCKVWKSPVEFVPVDPAFWFISASKAILSPSLDIIALYNSYENDLVFAHLGGVSWTKLPHISDGRLKDAIFHKGRLVLLDVPYKGSPTFPTSSYAHLIIFDLDNPMALPQILQAHLPIPYPQRNHTFLVESPDGDNLFLVLMEFDVDYYSLYPNPAKSIKVFKFDEDNNNNSNKWNQVTNIGDLALFVGPKCSLSMAAHHHFPCLKPNCVYFTDSLIYNSHKELHPDRVGQPGFCNLDDGSIHLFQPSSGFPPFNWPPPIWFTPTMY